MDSILTSIKKLLGIEEDYTHFDPDIIMCINTVFTVLTQIGIGPAEGFSIEDETAVWSDFIPNTHQMEAVKTYIHLRVKLLFDPPLSSSVTEAMKQQISEIEWRLYVMVENES